MDPRRASLSVRITVRILRYKVEKGLRAVYVICEFIQYVFFTLITRGWLIHSFTIAIASAEFCKLV